MDGLLIFPSQKILRRSLQRIDVYFANEERAMRLCCFPDEMHQAQLEDQRLIVAMAQSALMAHRQEGKRPAAKPSVLCSKPAG